MLSGPSTLAFLICLMALMFFISGTVTFVGRPLCYRLNGTGLFRNSSKCSTSLICFSLTSVTDFSCFFLTGCSGLLHFLTSFLIVSFGCLTCPFLPVCFIVVARSFTYFNLVLFFTHLFASVHLVCALTFSGLVRLLPCWPTLPESPPNCLQRSVVYPSASWDLGCWSYYFFYSLSLFLLRGFF